jgi:hypothetical protein
VAAPELARGLRLAAIHFPVRDLARLRGTIPASNVPSSTVGEAVVVPPAEALGATLVFTPAG